MGQVLRRLASTRLTLAGMALLAVGAGLSYGNPAHIPVWVLVVPLAFLGLNLVAAIATNPRINRRSGLLVFHVALLSIIVLAAIGRLTQLEAHLEIVEGSGFSSENLLDLKQGPWHRGDLDKIHFIQGPFTVDYAPGMIRGLTHSQLMVSDGQGGWERHVIGDDRPLVREGYRFYTTFHKGFAPVLTWIPQQGEAQTGTIHMPPYPLFEYRQANRWVPPGGEEIKFWLRLDTGLKEDAAWTLNGRPAVSTLVVNDGDRRVELEPGESVALNGGQLRYERLLTWMGYKVFYDPTLTWLFLVSIIGVLGLGSHFWQKFGMHRWPTRSSVPLGGEVETHKPQAKLPKGQIA